MADQLQRRACYSVHINTNVTVEASILKCDQQAEVTGIDLARFNRQAPPTTRRGERPQQPVLAVHHRH